MFGFFAILILLALLFACIIKIIEMFKRGLSGLEVCLLVDCILIQIFVIGAIPSHIVLVYKYFMELGEKTEAFLSLGSALGVIIWFASPFLTCACAKAIMEK